MKRLTFLLIILLLSACASSSSGNSKKLGQTDAAIAEGGDAISDGDYNKAITSFTDAINSANNDDDRSTAYTGLGFAQYRANALDPVKIADALSSFQTAVTLNSDNNDARAGLSLLEFAGPQDYSAAITQGEQVLANDAAFEMIFDDELNYNDILLTIALSHFYQAQYSDALNAVKRVDGQSSFNPNVSSTTGRLDLANRIDALIDVHKN